MRPGAALLALLAFVAAPLAAQEAVVSETVEESWTIADAAGTERTVSVSPAEAPSGIARFGPFRVLDVTHAALVGVTDAHSPAQFAAMLRAWPQIARIEMIECPGTEDDHANLALGRMIHAHGLVTHVPAGGSVRSGAVELFLAGARRVAESGAEFAVHSWEDENGREAADYPEDAPENRAYLDYYREMGMDATQARAFYAMTNSVPFAQARWLSAQELGRWVRLDKPESLDSGPSLQ